LGGVGAIKGQRANYARAIAQRSGFGFDPQTHEPGYMVVRESHRKRGISKAITERLLGVFERHRRALLRLQTIPDVLRDCDLALPVKMLGLQRKEGDR